MPSLGEGDEMIETQFAAGQAQRLSGLPGFPKESEAKRELVFALQVFPRHEHVVAFVDDWLKRESRCPLPVDIRRIANQLVEAEEETAKRSGCGLCHGVGYLSQAKRMAAGASVAPQDYIFASRCPNCWVKNGDKIEFKGGHVKGEWSKPLDLCSDCREWGAFGWVLRMGRYEHCPNEALHRGDVSDYLLDCMNGKPVPGSRKGGMSAPVIAEILRSA